MKFPDIKGCVSEFAQSTKSIMIAFQRKLEARCPAGIFVNGANDTREKGSMHMHASAASFCAFIVALNIVCMSAIAISLRDCILPSMDVHC